MWPWPGRGRGPGRGRWPGNLHVDGVAGWPDGRGRGRTAGMWPDGRWLFACWSGGWLAGWPWPDGRVAVCVAGWPGHAQIVPGQG